MESKRLVKKVIEAGLVPKHTLLLMQRWKLIDVEEGTKVPTMEEIEALTAEQLKALVDDIALVLEERSDMPEVMETDVRLHHLFRESRREAVVEILMGDQRVTISGVSAVMTREGDLVLRRTGAEKYIEHLARPGALIRLGEDAYEVRHVEVRYVGEAPEFYVCRVLKVYKEGVGHGDI